MSRTARRLLSWTARVVLTVTVTYFLFRSLNVSWSELRDLDVASWKPGLPETAASIGTLLVVFVFMVWLWARMVRALGGARLRLADSVRIFFLANLGRYVPGKVWQLAGLAYLAGKRGISIPVASSAAVLGQLCSLGAAAVVAGVALTLARSAALPGELLPVAGILAAAIAVVVAVPPVLRLALRTAFRLGGWAGAGAGEGAGAESVPELDAWFGTRWLGLYLPGWIGYGVAFGLLWSAFPQLPPVAWTLAIGSFAGAYFLGYAAVFAPAGVGVREGVLALLLTPSLGAASATVLALSARIWMTVVELLPLAWVALRQLAGRSTTKAETTGDGR